MELLENALFFGAGGVAGWLVALAVYWPEKCTLLDAAHLRWRRGRGARG